MHSRAPTNSHAATSVGRRSPVDLIVGKWDTVCRSLDLSETQYEPISQEIRHLLGSWEPHTIEDACNYNSEISEDGFPAEISVNFVGDRSQVRILFEALGDRPTRRSCLQAGADLTRRIISTYPGVSLERYLAIEDLFRAESNDSNSFICHSLAWAPGNSPDFKVYFSARDQDGRSNYELVDEAMRRLGLASPWQHVRGRLGQPGKNEARVPRMQYFALDLADTPVSRVKVYFRYCSNSPEELNAIAGLASQHEPAEVRYAYQQIYGDRDPPLAEHLICLAFLPNHTQPVWASTYLRLPVPEPPQEEKITKQIAAFMRDRAMDPTRYLAMMHYMSAQRDCRGHQELMKVTSESSEPHLTVYLRFNVQS